MYHLQCPCLGVNNSRDLKRIINSSFTNKYISLSLSPSLTHARDAHRINLPFLQNAQPFAQAAIQPRKPRVDACPPCLTTPIPLSAADIQCPIPCLDHCCRRRSSNSRRGFRGASGERFGVSEVCSAILPSDIKRSTRAVASDDVGAVRV